jgi:hypothetical protein
MKVEIKDKLFKDIEQYCKTNNIEDIDKFINKILNQGFAGEKYGSLEPKEKNIKKEIIPIKEESVIKIDKKKSSKEKESSEDIYGEEKLREI